VSVVYSMDVERDIDSAVEFSEMLNRMGVQGEFYVTGVLVEKYPDKVKKIAKYHILGGHGYDHEDFAKLSRRDVRKYVSRTVKVFEKNGLKIRGWRFPYLSYTGYAMSYVASLGLYDSSIRDVVWSRWGIYSFFRNWVRNLLRGILTWPTCFGRVVENPWSFADLSCRDVFSREGRLVLHDYMFKNWGGKFGIQ
jgi:peptidoglycan/xylan/chitin deacetylase (PgdA/CDA1 family)